MSTAQENHPGQTRGAEPKGRSQWEDWEVVVEVRSWKSLAGLLRPPNIGEGSLGRRTMETGRRNRSGTLGLEEWKEQGFWEQVGWDCQQLPVSHLGPLIPLSFNFFTKIR